MRWIVLIGALPIAVSACYSPEFRDCATACSGVGQCPVGTTCLADGFCHARADEPLCDDSVGDGAGGGDAGQGACDPCELVAQCGCASNEACDDPLDPSCRPAGGGRQGDLCDAPADCAAGFTCLGGAGDGRACYRYCDDDSTCQGGGGVCNVDIGGGSQLVCTTDCDPVTSRGCPASWGCSAALNPNTDRWHTNCHEGGAGGQDEPCETLEDCLPGFHCAAFANPFCMRSCIVGDDSTCTGGRVCRGFSGGAVIDGVEYGGCLF